MSPREVTAALVGIACGLIAVALLWAAAERWLW